MKRLELDKNERQNLLKLLEEHLEYGWVEKTSEGEAIADFKVSPVLKGLYQRLKEAEGQPVELDENEWKDLLKLLDQHLYFGWLIGGEEVEGLGLKIIPTGRITPHVLEDLLWRLKTMQYDLSTSTGRAALVAACHALYGKRTSDLPLEGVFDFGLHELFKRCINIPPRETLEALHREALSKTGDRYYVGLLTPLLNAFAALVGVEGVSGAPVSRLAQRRIEQAVGEALGGGDFENTPLFEIIQAIGDRVDQARRDAFTWGSLIRYIDKEEEA